MTQGHRNIDPRLEWLTRHENGWQFGEQGVLDAIVAGLDMKPQYCLEFGVGDPASTQVTTSRLVVAGWQAVFIEGDEAIAQAVADDLGGVATVLSRRVGFGDDDGIDAILSECEGFPENPGVAVIDIDSTDWYVWRAMRKYRPTVVVIEHRDISDPGNIDVPEVPAPEICGHRTSRLFARQANWQAIHDLGIEKGYVPVWRGNINTIFVDAASVEPLYRDVPVKLNIGDGGKGIEGYIPIDIRYGIDARTLPYPDNSVDEVYASHVLEHFGHRETDAVLAEWSRVLKPNGLIRISVPDRAKIEAARTPENSGLLDRVLMGGQDNEHDFHKSAWDTKSLARAMRQAQISGIREFIPLTMDCSAAPISTNLCGRKRWWPRLDNPEVMLVLSEGRLGFSGFHSRLRQLVRELGVNEARVGSAFWEQAMQRGVEEALSTPAQIILFTDGDSVFQIEDYERLLETLQSDPQCAAVGCVQISRHNDKPLVHDETLDYSGPTTQVKYSHFGLTLIRRQVFEELPKPWFWGMPNDRGNYGEGRASDPDITFWRLLSEHGFKVLQDNRVIIGHIQEGVKYPGENGVIYQPAQSAFKQGRPKGVRFNPAVFKRQPPVSRPGVGVEPAPGRPSEEAVA